MAFTVSNMGNSVFGNKVAKFLRVTADAADGSVVTGLGVVENVSLGPQSMATASVRIKMNLTGAGTAANGSLTCSGVASGDVFNLLCIGH